MHVKANHEYLGDDYSNPEAAFGEPWIYYGWLVRVLPSTFSSIASSRIVRGVLIGHI